MLWNRFSHPNFQSDQAKPRQRERLILLLYCYKCWTCSVQYQKGLSFRSWYSINSEVYLSHFVTQQSYPLHMWPHKRNTPLPPYCYIKKCFWTRVTGINFYKLWGGVTSLQVFLKWITVSNNFVFWIFQIGFSCDCSKVWKWAKIVDVWKRFCFDICWHENNFTCLETRETGGPLHIWIKHSLFLLKFFNSSHTWGYAWS